MRLLFWQILTVVYKTDRTPLAYYSFWKYERKIKPSHYFSIGQMGHFSSFILFNMLNENIWDHWDYRNRFGSIFLFSWLETCHLDIELSAPPIISCLLCEEVLPARGCIKFAFLKLCAIPYFYPKNMNIPWNYKGKINGYLSYVSFAIVKFLSIPTCSFAFPVSFNFWELLFFLSFFLPFFFLF